MGGSDALDLVMFRLGNRTDTTTRAIALQEMKLLKTSLEGGSFHPWFLFQRYSTGYALTAGVGTLALPSGFLQLDEEEDALTLYDPTTGLGVVPSNVSTRLPRESVQNMELFFDSPGTPALPEGYAVLNETIYVRPLPDLAYLVELPCFMADAQVEDKSTETLWLEHASDLLIAGTVAVVAKGLRDWEVANDAKVELEAARRRLFVRHESLIHTARRYAMKGDS